MSNLPEVALYAALAITVAMLAMWLLSIAVRDASIIDIFWGPGFAVIAWVGLAAGNGAAGRSVLVALLVTAWALRLGGYLAWRNLGHGEDVRYQRMRRHHGDRFWRVSLYTVFGLQGVLMLIVSLPVQMSLAAPEPTALGVLDYAGAALWLTGFLFEAIGDVQLARFKADPSSPGQVMDRGLWAWTRHPNYFGNFAMWWGLYLIACSVPWGWATAVGPLVMSYFLMRVSGVPMLERGLHKTRPGYAEYVERTPSFFPRPPRAPEVR